MMLLGAKGVMIRSPGVVGFGICGLGGWDRGGGSGWRDDARKSMEILLGGKPDGRASGREVPPADFPDGKKRKARLRDVCVIIKMIFLYL